MVVVFDWVVVGPVVGNDVPPASVGAVVLGAAVKDVAMEEDGITSLHLAVDQWQHT